MDVIAEWMYKIMVGGGLLAVFLIAMEAVLYYKSWSILQKLKGKLNIPEDKKNYAFESSLSLINLLMTAILNVVIILVFGLIALALLYSIVYLTEYFIIILAVSVVFFVTLLYICIKMIHEYNRDK